jgi:hypothetical protein
VGEWLEVVVVVWVVGARPPVALEGVVADVVLVVAGDELRVLAVLIVGAVVAAGAVVAGAVAVVGVEVVVLVEAVEATWAVPAPQPAAARTVRMPIAVLFIGPR